MIDEEMFKENKYNNDIKLGSKKLEDIDIKYLVNKYIKKMNKLS